MNRLLLLFTLLLASILPAAAQRTVSICMVGDIMPGTTYPDSTTLAFLSRTPEKLFEKTSHIFKGADLTIGNLESTLVDIGDASPRKKAVGNNYIFRTPTQYAGIMKKAGIDVLTVANNHLFDFGAKGLKSTVGALDKAGISDQTLVILTSDNGPVVDDGYADQAVALLGDHQPWGHFRGGKYSSFEAGTRVPFIVNWPGQVKPGVSDALFSHIDLFASMAKLAQVEYDGQAGIDSHDFLQTLLGNETKGREYVIEAAGSLAVSDGEWKYIAPSDGPAYNKLTNTELGNSKEEQLYCLKEDPGEQVNVAHQYPDKVKAFQAILEREKQTGYKESWKR